MQTVLKIGEHYSKTQTFFQIYKYFSNILTFSENISYFLGPKHFFVAIIFVFLLFLLIHFANFELYSNTLH